MHGDLLGGLNNNTFEAYDTDRDLHASRQIDCVRACQRLGQLHACIHWSQQGALKEQQEPAGALRFM